MEMQDALLLTEIMRKEVEKLQKCLKERVIPLFCFMTVGFLLFMNTFGHQWTYDDYPVISIMQFEDLGFCEKGAASEFIQANTLTCDGTFPHNTSGGQLSVGQAGAAGGFLGLVEAIRQLTGGAGENAVIDAHIAAVSGFGIINFDRGLCSGAALLASGQQ